MSKQVTETSGFICPSCGWEMAYDEPSAKAKCGHCGAEEAVCEEGDKEDIDFAAIEADADRQDWGFPTKVVRCAGCDARFIVAADAALLSCPLCSSSQLADTDEAPGLRPDSAIPFKLDANAAGSRFTQWVQRRRLAPFSMKKEYEAGLLSGVYIPYWSFDAKTKTAYSGQAGDYYRETEQDTHTENGQTAAQPKSVKKLRWRFVSGAYEKAFGGIIYSDSREISEDTVRKLEPFKLNELEKFNPRLLGGHFAQRYGEGPGAAWKRAKAYMSGVIRGDVKGIIKRGSDALGALHICPEYSGIKYRLMLLPVWMGSYRYHNKTYRCYINAQTGEITGDAPLSALKIFILIMTALIVLAALYFLLLYKK